MCLIYQMDLSVQEALQIYNAKKHLTLPVEWKNIPNREHKDPQRQIGCRVKINDGIKRCVFFRATIFPDYPETMMFQLEVDQSDIRARKVIYRLDVCPRGAHTNLTGGGLMI